MTGIELRKVLPESFSKEAERMGVEDRELRGRPRIPPLSRNEKNRVEIERVVRYIRDGLSKG